MASGTGVHENAGSAIETACLAGKWGGVVILPLCHDERSETGSGRLFPALSVGSLVNSELAVQELEVILEILLLQLFVFV